MKETISSPETHELLPAPEHHELLTAKASPEKAGESPAANAHETAQQARETLEQLSSTETASNPLSRLEAEEKATQPASPTVLTRQLKRLSKNRGLISVRRQLPPAQRAFSRVIHQPVISAVSEGAAKTVSRPSGLLGGGLTAFIGSSAYLYLTHHVGFRANYLVFLLLFFGGFLLGLLLEFAVWLATARHRQPD